MYMGRLVYERVGISLFEVNEKPGRFWSVNTVKGLNRVESEFYSCERVKKFKSRDGNSETLNLSLEISTGNMSLNPQFGGPQSVL